MARSNKPARGGGGGRRRSEADDEIETEFLGVWMAIARLREKVLALAAGAPAQPQSPQRPRA